MTAAYLVKSKYASQHPTWLAWTSRLRHHLQVYAEFGVSFGISIDLVEEKDRQWSPCANHWDSKLNLEFRDAVAYILPKAPITSTRSRSIPGSIKKFGVHLVVFTPFALSPNRSLRLPYGVQPRPLRGSSRCGGGSRQIGPKPVACIDMSKHIPGIGLVYGLIVLNQAAGDEAARRYLSS